MIIDCHTHLFGPDQIGGDFLAAARKAWGSDFQLLALPEDHQELLSEVDHAVVLAFNCPEVGAVVPNDYVAAYVTRHPDRLVGFASVTPNAPACVEELEEALDHLHLSGVKLAPFYQKFYPDVSRQRALYHAIDRRGIPIMWHQGTSFVPSGYLDASRPALLDPIAREFPDLPMVVAHAGHPWITETIALVRKNPQVYFDVSALFSRPWQLYNTLIAAQEYGISHKILFGSDYPFFRPREGVQRLRAINQLVEGTSLPRVSAEVVEGIIHRNAFELLRIGSERQEHG